MLMQLDAAWMAASAGVTTVIASGKEKDGVLQVTAGMCTFIMLACVVFVYMACDGCCAASHTFNVHAVFV